MMDSSADIGKIITLIMENPAIIEQIKALAEKGREKTEDGEPRTQSASASDGTEPTMAKDIANGDRGQADDRGGSFVRRKKLLFALKPYISSERARAIDTMLSLTEAMDALRGL